MNTDLHASIRAFERKQITVSALGLLLLICASIVLNYVNVNGVAEQSAKFISRMIQLRDFREVAITLQEARLDRFKSIRYVSAEKERSFVLPETAELFSAPSAWERIAFDEITIRARDPQGANSQDLILFQYNRFLLVPWAVLFWLLLNLASIPPTRIIKKRIVAQYEKDLLIQKDLVRADLAKKVRHNIRTPLSALLRLSGSARGLNQQEGELFQSIIAQIRTLISELDERPSFDQGTDANAANLYECVRNSVQEIRLTIPLQISFTSQIQDSVVSALVYFDAFEMRSILSNLVNNSIEAMPDGGSVSLEIEDVGHEILIHVTDTGLGIPQEIINRVTEKGFSHGKSHGTGIGLWHASESVKRWSGRIDIQSSPHGTTVSICLPISERAPWYTPRVKLAHSDTVIVIDDQVAAHRLWKMRLDEAQFNGEVRFFDSVDDANDLLADGDIDFERTVVFADYDLGEEAANGVECLSQLSPLMRRYLVTGHFDQIEIQSACAERNIGLIPKTELADIPLILVQSRC